MQLPPPGRSNGRLVLGRSLFGARGSVGKLRNTGASAPAPPRTSRGGRPDGERKKRKSSFFCKSCCLGSVTFVKRKLRFRCSPGLAGNGGRGATCGLCLCRIGMNCADMLGPSSTDEMLPAIVWTETGTRNEFFSHGFVVARGRKGCHVRCYGPPDVDIRSATSLRAGRLFFVCALAVVPGESHYR